MLLFSFHLRYLSDFFQIFKWKFPIQPTDFARSQPGTIVGNVLVACEYLCSSASLTSQELMNPTLPSTGHGLFRQALGCNPLLLPVVPSPEV